MLNFRINSNEDAQPEQEAHLYDIGTTFRFSEVAGQIKARLAIPVICL